MLTIMENAKKVNIVPEKETFLHCAEQPDSPKIKVDQQVNKVMVNGNIEKIGTTTYDLTMQTDINIINLDHKELKNEYSQIHEDKIMQHKESSISVNNDITYKKEKPIAKAEKMTNKVNKRVSARKSKKNDQLLNDKKENLKKISSDKVVKKKAATKKSYKTSLKLGTSQVLKQRDKEILENYTKVELYKINTEGCMKCNLPLLAPVRSENNIYNTKFPCPSVVKQQQLYQYGLENNTNMLQHLDYNNLKYTSQQAVPATNSWMTLPKANENFSLNNNINNMQIETGHSYIKHQHHAYAADYNWKQNGNPYFNCVINSTDPYKLLPENKTCYSCNIYGSNYMWNNMYMQNFPRTNAMLQQATSNIAPTNCTALSINTSNNFLSSATTPFNPFYYHPPLMIDDNFKKLYTSFNNNGCELTGKENMMPPSDSWHHSNSLMLPSNSSLNIPAATPTWYNAPSNFSDASTSTILPTDVDKVQFKYEQNTYLTNHHDADMTKASVCKDQFAPYIKPALQNTLPAITPVFTLPIDTHALQSYKAPDIELTSTLTHQNSTATNTSDNMISNIVDLSPETTAIEVAEELSVPYMYTKEKKLISEVLESIL